jgi:hypothetical protein
MHEQMKLHLPSSESKPTTSEVIELLVTENKHISAIFVFSYAQPLLVQERLHLSVEEGAIVESAKDLRSLSGLPFWESLLLSCFNRQKPSSRLISAATFHQSHSHSLTRIPRAEILAGILPELMREQEVGHHLSLSSKVEIGHSETRHLPLLDFHCPESTENDELVKAVCSTLNQDKTLIFSSGKSYHSMSLDLMNDLNFHTFLIRALLFAPIVDSRYVAHQLLEGECALRLTHSKDKPSRPRLKFVV